MNTALVDNPITNTAVLSKLEQHLFYLHLKLPDRQVSRVCGKIRYRWTALPVNTC